MRHKIYLALITVSYILVISQPVWKMQLFDKLTGYLISDSAIPLISGDTIEQFERYSFIDVRPDEERKVGTIPGAISWDYANNDTLPAFDPGKPLILFCTAGIRSDEAARLIRKSNPDLPVYNLSGGLIRWERTGLPLVDYSGTPTDSVHPYNKFWGWFLY